MRDMRSPRRRKHLCKGGAYDSIELAALRVLHLKWNKKKRARSPFPFVHVGREDVHHLKFDLSNEDFKDSRKMVDSLNQSLCFLATLWSMGWVHGDIHPATNFVVYKDELYLYDFEPGQFRCSWPPREEEPEPLLSPLDAIAYDCYKFSELCASFLSRFQKNASSLLLFRLGFDLRWYNPDCRHGDEWAFRQTPQVQKDFATFLSRVFAACNICQSDVAPHVLQYL